jgi:hypothetical protein
MVSLGTVFCTQNINLATSADREIPPPALYQAAFQHRRFKGRQVSAKPPYPQTVVANRLLQSKTQLIVCSMELDTLLSTLVFSLPRDCETYSNLPGTSFER